MSTRTRRQMLCSVCAGVGTAVVTAAAASSGDQAEAVEGVGAVCRNCQGAGAVTCKFLFLFVSSGYCLEMSTSQPHYGYDKPLLPLKHVHRMQHDIPGVCIETVKKLSHGLQRLS